MTGTDIPQSAVDRMIALTRPIDTLVVSFQDKGSVVARIFQDAARRHGDFVEWR
jgi:hypothetical protein